MTEKNSNKGFESSLTHHMVRGGSVVLFFSLLSMPIGYLTRMIYSRSLSIEMFGLFYSVLAFLTLISSLNDLGFSYSLNYLVPKFIKKNNPQSAWNAFYYDQLIEFITSVVISGLLFFTAGFLATSYFKVDIADEVVKILLLFFIADSILSAVVKFFMGLQQEKYFSSAKVVKMGFSLLFSAIFFFWGKGNIITYAASWSAAHIISAVIYSYLLRKRNHDTQRPFSWDRELFVRMFKYAVPTLLASSIWLVSAPLDNILLILFKDLRDVGIYNVVLPLILVSPIFLSPLNSLILPMVSKLEEEPEKLKMLFEAMLKIVPYVALYFALFVFLFPETILQTVFGSKWMLIAKYPLQVAVLGYVMQPISSVIGTFSEGLGMVRERFKLSVVSTVFKLLINTILVYYFGIIGAIVANVSMFTFLSIFFSIMIRKKVNFTLPIDYYTKLVIFGLVMFGLVKLWGTTPRGLIAIITLGIGYTMMYIVLGFVVEVVDRSSLRLLLANAGNIKWFK